jgi:hypothetical protein
MLELHMVADQGSEARPVQIDTAGKHDDWLTRCCKRLSELDLVPQEHGELRPEWLRPVAVAGRPIRRAA